jgi:O-antigen/teichoic acid export membrane protein
MLGAGDKRSYSKVLWVSIAVNAALALCAAGVVIAGSGLIMRGYGREFDSGRLVLVILALSAVLAATVNVVGQTIASAGRMWWGFALNTIWAAVLLATVFTLRGRGALGFATGNLVAYGVHLVTVSVYAWFQIPKQLAGEAAPRPAEGTA